MYFIAPLQENAAITLGLARSLGHVRAAEFQVQIRICKALLRLYIAGPGHHVHGLVLDLPARRLTVAVVQLSKLSPLKSETALAEGAGPSGSIDCPFTSGS